MIFTTKKGKKVTISVLDEFIKVCPKPEDYSVTELALPPFNIVSFLHNEHGPATYDHKNDIKRYWLKGNPATPEQEYTIQHKESFYETLEKIIK